MNRRRVAITALTATVAAAILGLGSLLGPREAAATPPNYEVQFANEVLEIPANGIAYRVADIQARTSIANTGVTSVVISDQGAISTCNVVLGQSPYSLHGSPSGLSGNAFANTGVTMWLAFPVAANNTCTRSGAIVTATFSTLNVDTTPPVVTITATETGIAGAYVSGSWAHNRVVVSFSCSDPGPNASGVKTNSYPSALSYTNDGSYTITANPSWKCVDNAGNFALPPTAPSLPFVVNLDKHAPTCSIALPSVQVPLGGQAPVSFSVSSADTSFPGPTPTLLSITVPAGGQVVSGFNSGSPFSGRVTGAPAKGVYYLTYQVMDAAGNSSTCSAKITVAAH